MTLQLTPWQTPQSLPQLTEEDVHLWRFPLDIQESLDDLLDEQELRRAARLRAPIKARTFITARGRLRQILAGYLDCAPQSLPFEYGPAGKPALAGPLPAPIAFNLAHSGHWGLCAVTRGSDVGVDIENLDRKLDFENLAARFFSPVEQARLLATAPHRRRRQFFRIWTRKEAWLKGKGGGFSDPHQDIGAAHLAGACTHDGGWWLRSLPVDRHHLATLAVTRPFSLVWRWDGWPGR